jgi:hypothetical protein
MSGGAVVRRGERRSALGFVAAVSALAIAGLLAAATRVSILGHWYGLFLLRGREGPTLELKDDLVLGDASRLVIGIPFSPIRSLLEDARPRAGQARLDLDWDEREGSGSVLNHLADGTDLITIFSRYEDSEGLVPHGLFVGGALPDIAADARLQNESGMSHRDARGWTHVWCNVNEAVWIPGVANLSYPSQWRFLGSRVLIRDAERVVLESSHEITDGGARLRMDRFAYFRAGLPYFRLGIRFTNVGDRDQRFTYAYGDEPWVGEFGSAEGNIGWTGAGYVATEAALDPRAERWAGILDEKTGAANFIAWVGEDLPDTVYFSNSPGPPRGRGLLESNEVFIGLEWPNRVLRPGEARSMLLAIGLAGRDPATGRPALPEGAGPNR